ncbi:alcohol dehydrogenase [Comamonas thiooxydans]|uniref:Alcohol dehydrogenase n=2 Tax=Comamonas thiooxydans TaxID=363952 RepID=A0A0E3CBP7_9BURK|nr:alcohol dehydrogenase [Comamonas thiooxydans]KGH18120.1 alcohol dehydrogenase [Comamonas thiooxydans]KGH28159.1 alcohol dehydrogenase [Comamonas thiooxydans]
MHVPDEMLAWILDSPGKLTLTRKKVPSLASAEVLVRVDAVAICATDLEVIAHGRPAMVEGKLPFGSGFTPGHEYMGTVVAVAPDVNEFVPGDRVTGEVHAGCRRCRRCRQGMYTSCLNYGFPSKGHRANGFSTDGAFAQYTVNNINTLCRVPDSMGDAEATLAVTAGTSLYGFDELGGVLAHEAVVILGPGPIGLLAVGVAKALGAGPVILTGTRDSRLELGKQLGADATVNVTRDDPVEMVRKLTQGRMADMVMECSGAPEAVDQSVRMLSRGGKLCLAAFPAEPVPFDVGHLVRNNIYVYGIRGEGKSAVWRAIALMEQRKFDARLIHSHTFAFEELPQALHQVSNRLDDAIKVVVNVHETLHSSPIRKLRPSQADDAASLRVAA